MSLLPPKNKTKVPRLIRTKTKSPVPPNSNSAEPAGGAPATTVATAANPQPKELTASARQAPSKDAVRSPKKVKPVKTKRLLSSPLTKHKSTTLGNDDAQMIINHALSNNTKVPRMHRDMRILCDEFRISEQSRLALRKYDATRLEDFCYMTDEDYATMIDMQGREGCPMPPLQQRKIRVLLMWARSLMDSSSSNGATTTATNTVVEEDAKTGGDRTPTTTATTAISSLTKPGGMEWDSTIPSPITLQPPPPPRRTASAASGIIVPSDWEKRFHADLPSLKEELKKLGGEPSSLPSWLSSFRIFCGFA